MKITATGKKREPLLHHFFAFCRRQQKREKRHTKDALHLIPWPPIIISCTPLSQSHSLFLSVGTSQMDLQEACNQQHWFRILTSLPRPCPALLVFTCYRTGKLAAALAVSQSSNGTLALFVLGPMCSQALSTHVSVKTTES